MNPLEDGRSYAQLRVGSQPSGFLVEALNGVDVPPGPVLDLGAGALNNARWLVKQGRAVHAIDIDPHMLSLARTLGHPRLRITCGDLREVQLAKETYALVVAIHVLPFMPRVDLSRVIDRIVNSMKPQGILCCTLFGTQDGWAGVRPKVTFLGRAEVDALLTPLHPLSVTEDRRLGVDAHDRPKMWHVYRCVLRKDRDVDRHDGEAFPG